MPRWNYAKSMRRENETQYARFAPNRLWLQRRKVGYSRRMVARLLGHKGTTHVSAYENGKRTPSLRTALKLAIILSMPVEFLYYDLHAQLKTGIQMEREALYSTEG